MDFSCVFQPQKCTLLASKALPTHYHSLFVPATLFPVLSGPKMLPITRLTTIALKCMLHSIQISRYNIRYMLLHHVMRYITCYYKNNSITCTPPNSGHVHRTTENAQSQSIQIFREFPQTPVY